MCRGRHGLIRTHAAARGHFGRTTYESRASIRGSCIGVTIVLMLDPRAQHLLKSLIERYIADGQPVGSRVLSRQTGLELSPATIRNVMADLEEMGFIASPHTSAGRVPTSKGYRFFVDSLMVVKELDDVEISELQDQLQSDRTH